LDPQNQFLRFHLAEKRKLLLVARRPRPLNPLVPARPRQRPLRPDEIPPPAQVPLTQGEFDEFADLNREDSFCRRCHGLSFRRWEVRRNRICGAEGTKPALSGLRRGRSQRMLSGRFTHSAQLKMGREPHGERCCPYTSRTRCKTRHSPLSFLAGYWLTSILSYKIKTAPGFASNSLLICAFGI
jgi:hypothetical protein